MSERKVSSIPAVSFHIIFQGRVQGVGFRFTAQRFANELGLTGWVMNCPGEDVELCVEGDEASCQDLIKRLQAHFSINDVKMSAHPVTGTYTSFEIRY